MGGVLSSGDQFIEVGGGLFQEVFFGGLVGKFFAEIFSAGHGKSFRVRGKKLPILLNSPKCAMGVLCTLSRDSGIKEVQFVPKGSVLQNTVRRHRKDFQQGHFLAHALKNLTEQFVARLDQTSRRRFADTGIVAWTNRTKMSELLLITNYEL